VPLDDIFHVVSIPQSEFCPLGPEKIGSYDISLIKFQFLSRNSVRWDRGKAIHPRTCYQFQFLSRNSVRWDGGHAGATGLNLPVSIPQSEFCPLGL